MGRFSGSQGEPRCPGNLASSQEMVVPLLRAAHLGTEGLDVMLSDLEVGSDDKTNRLFSL